MTHSLRSLLASLLVLSVITLQALPLTVVYADDTTSTDTAATTAPATDTASATDTTTDSSTQTAADTTTASSDTTTQDSTTPQADTQTNTADTQSAPADTAASTDATTTTSDTSTAPVLSDASSTSSATNESSTDATTTDSASSDTTATTQGPSFSAPVSDPASNTTTDSTSSSSSDTTAATTSTSNASSSLDVTSNGSSTAEQHDVLDVHATSSDPTFSVNGVLDQINDAASSSVAGFVGGGSGGGSVADNATGTEPVASSTASVPDATTTREIPEIASGTPAVISGSAVAIANILNILNSSFVNSSGAILFSNLINPGGTVDFRNPSFFLGLCGSVSCSGATGLQLNLLNDGTIDNHLIVSANAGENTVQSNTDGAIVTGDAFAGLNLINLANVTIANSNYLLIALNAFRGINGDIIFPSLADFFAPLINGNGGAAGISLSNDATVANDVTAGANSGDNTVQMGPNGTSSIQTGASTAQANVFNQINSLLAGSGLSILVRLSGNWNGEVQGAPEGLTWVRTPEGILFTGSATGTSQAPGIYVNGTSTADINNAVRVGALSGANDLTASTTGLISTGNSFAGANVINIANQTVIGRNWIMAIINIFGDFTGNIAFGKPDLWVGAQAQAPGQIQPGDVLHYKVTVLNNGDAQATAAKLKEITDPSHVEILSASLPFTNDGGTLLFDLGTIAKGGAKEITFDAKVTAFASNDRIVSTSEALLHESDNNPSDNTDSTTVQNVAIGGGGGGSGGIYIAPSAAAATTSTTTTSAIVPTATLQVTRSTPFVSVESTSTTGTEALVVYNDSDTPASGVRLDDIIRNAAGEIIHEEMFDIGSMAPHEEVTVSYDISFANTPTGTYMITTEIVGTNVGAQIYANGEIRVAGEPMPLPTLPLSTAIIPTTRSIRTTHALSPLVPDTGSWSQPDATLTSAAADNTSMTAAAGSVDSGISEQYIRLVSYCLLLLSIFGALRLMRPF